MKQTGAIELARAELEEYRRISCLSNHNFFTKMEGMLERNSGRESQSRSSGHLSIPYICKVPEELRKQKQSAYKPRVVSIGPIHRMDNHVQAMQDVKLKYTNDLLLRMAREMGDNDLSECSRIALWLIMPNRTYRDLADRARKYYTEKVVDVDIDQFAEMLLIDGCFILELLFKSLLVKQGNIGPTDTDPVCCSPLRLLDIRHDLLLLENQIPFFVLLEFFNVAMKFIKHNFHLDYLSQFVVSFFDNVMNFEACDSEFRTLRFEETDHHHILHLLHSFYVPPYDPPLWGNNLGTPPKFTSSASDLKWTGVKFVPCAPKEPFNLKFNKGRGPFWFCGRPRFEIPPLCIYDATEPFLRNLIAFEQCCPGVRRHFTSYAFLMKTLIGSPEDAQVLEEAGVIRNYLNASEDPFNLFQNICKEVDLREFYFTKQCAEAGMHSSNRWPRILATLKRDYFGNPWSGLAVVAAIVLFGLTVLQTLYGALSYYQ